MNLEQAAFEKAFEKTMLNEGIKSNDPLDLGGATKFGISKRFLETVTGGPVTTAYVMGLSFSDAKEIYRVHFWYAPKIHRIHDDEMREAVFDQAVNRGPANAVIQFQTAINRVTGSDLDLDGAIGALTLEAFLKAESFEVRLAFIQECHRAYARIAKNNPTQLRFLLGWLDRAWTYI